jgi:hypothetical protein
LANAATGWWIADDGFVGETRSQCDDACLVVVAENRPQNGSNKAEKSDPSANEPTRGVSIIGLWNPRGGLFRELLGTQPVFDFIERVFELATGLLDKVLNVLF